jgi:cyclophilin family peptidyl-prolyl cis-trans isomerase
MRRIALLLAVMLLALNPQTTAAQSWLAHAAGVAALPQAAAAETSKSTSPIVVIDTSKGVIKVELYPEEAPKTVENFLKYVEDGHYDDTIFHRVIAGLIIQGGGYTPELREKPTRKPIPLEAAIGLQNVRGTIAMARTASRNSATAQFFINVGTNKEFDRSADNFGYAVFGRVVEGMNVVDLIAKAQTSRRPPFDDIPILPVIIEKIRRVQPQTELQTEPRP